MPTIAFWTPGSAPRALTVVDLYTATASARHLALAFEDGRVALLDRAIARAAATPLETPPPTIPKTCTRVDPFDLPPRIVDQ